MQILLTHDEYGSLKEKAGRAVEYDDLQKLCTLVANFAPATRSWDTGNESPWGCLLDEESNPEYCDDCPAEEMCPYEYKQFSQ